ncbi:N-acetylmuramoyl-L-alanine amidase [Mangrovibacillus cuniculi]|uniref:SH3 domain-containing protein n=1 Tax=Mangrovibacillus cuniculi TaxID=2593652 RepID=A0A7S8CBP3_9BACI|nr:N-acetylmuramoyl-L-alanine amidase [Mangrovibacillus cuniculi]QPC47011.1 SH3 domain-containing protein [Mangrovibacillus cuniculi]
MKKIHIFISILLVLSIISFPVGASAAIPLTEEMSTSNSKGLVLVESLRLRTSPSLDSEVLKTLSQNTEVTVLAQQGDWTNISINSETGWVASEYIGNNSSEKKEEIVVSTVENLSIRTEPSIEGKVLGVLTKGKSYTLLEQKYGWKKVQWNPNQTGWVAGYYTINKVPTKNESTPERPNKQIAAVTNLNNKQEQVTMIYDGTNLRSEPSTSSAIVAQTKAGDMYPVLKKEGEWYLILFGDKEVYVADWVVQTVNIAPSKDAPLIMLDAGHGGRDSGAIGYFGTLEKLMTLQTTLRVKQKLEADGYEVELTRTDDYYVSLEDRVTLSNASLTDLFLSFHYDSVEDETAHGHTTYYYHERDRNLSQIVHDSIAKSVELRDREVRFGDYYVLRENLRPAILLELGYLSNEEDERVITHRNFQELVSTAIADGVKRAIPYQGVLVAQNQ